MRSSSCWFYFVPTKAKELHCFYFEKYVYPQFGQWNQGRRVEGGSRQLARPRRIDSTMVLEGMCRIMGEQVQNATDGKVDIGFKFE